MLQWYRTGGSPLSIATINTASDLTGGSGGGNMTVPLHRGSMGVLQPSRSRFMITDILAGSGGGLLPNQHGNRSPSPQGPRDLSLPLNSRHDDSDSDDNLDDRSISSNGAFSNLSFNFNI